MLESLAPVFWAFWTALLMVGLMGAEPRRGKPGAPRREGGFWEEEEK